MKESPTAGELNGYLGKGTWIKGEIHFTDTLRVDGKVTGKIVSDRELIVGQSGEVEAEIDVGTLSVTGKVSGVIKVKNRVEIHRQGRMYGELRLSGPTLVIEEGAVFEGSVDMKMPREEETEEPVAEVPRLKSLHEAGRETS